MAKRGYKLQEFVAHSANVNCLSMGKKACRLLISGGDDHKVNLWAIGKPTSLMSLCGHTSPVESVAFDSEEVLVLAGASTGVIKLWDLEEAKMVRALTGHRSSCTAVEFHPFGEFFASGSMDTNLKIWDIRKKGCIHTYKGHTRGISTIRFTPDGRWVVSGGFDNVVKVWDLTAGKLLHDFKFHEGHIRSLDFHPLEFLLATGSADRTVKFWDLETFELIGSSRPEATGVRSITFHPDGRTLFCGSDDGLKVYSWEPVVCHDSIDMGWSTLGDICINDGKLLGCSYYRNSVGVWVVNTAHIQPYGGGTIPEQSDCKETKLNLHGSHSSEKIGSDMRSPSARSMSPDYETKEIKNIYVDTSAGKPITSQKAASLNSPKVILPLDSDETSDPRAEKQSPDIGLHAKPNGELDNKSFIVPSVVPRDSPVGKDSSKSQRESITFSRTKPGMLLRPAHSRRPSNTKNEVEKLSSAVESTTLSNVKTKVENEMDLDSKTRVVAEEGATRSYVENDSDIKSITEKFRKTLSPQPAPNQETCNESLGCDKDTKHVKVVRGVAVVQGRTRSLVERFERRDRFNTNEDQATSITSYVAPETDKTPTIMKGERQIGTRQTTSAYDGNVTESQVSGREATSASNGIDSTGSQIARRESASTNDRKVIIAEGQISRRELTNANDGNITGNQIARRELTSTNDGTITRSQIARRELASPNDGNVTGSQIARRELASPNDGNVTGSQIARRELASANDGNITGSQIARKELACANDGNITGSQIFRRESTLTNERKAIITESHFSRREPTSANDMNITITESQVSKTESILAKDGDIIESLMQTHDVFLSTLRSRLTKLQVVRHFWERNDVKAAISALQKLPDHSVQADVIGVLIEKMELLTLDLFSCLLPVLMGLLDSRMERHIIVSLEMLLKLVAVFGPVIHSTISAPRAVGVDLHAEQRLECCNRCFIQLQKIQKLLPMLIRRGGSLARSAQELNLILQES